MRPFHFLNRQVCLDYLTLLKKRLPFILEGSMAKSTEYKITTFPSAVY